MLLATGSLFELGQFIRIVLWIFLPVFIVTFFLTSLYHYRRRKKRQAAEEDDFSFSPDTEESKADYILFDHTGLLRQYRNKLSYNQARYAALKQDFEQLEIKYAAASSGSNSITPSKNMDMENRTEQLQATINQLTTDFENEKKEWYARLEQLDRSYKSLESENESLLEQINMSGASDDQKEIFVNKWREENQLLKEKIAEQAWIADLMEEKKSQIDFLQQQLEQRIKNYHQAERQKEEVVLELEKERQRQGQAVEELQQLRQEMAGRQDQLIYKDNQLQEIKLQNEWLNAAVNDSKERMAVLEEQLQEEQEKAYASEQKLAANKQLLHRLYEEFTACINEEEETAPPVVVLHPSYSKAAEE